MFYRISLAVGKGTIFNQLGTESFIQFFLAYRYKHFSYNKCTEKPTSSVRFPNKKWILEICNFILLANVKIK